jgi:hypothetical protein
MNSPGSRSLDGDEVSPRGRLAIEIRWSGRGKRSGYASLRWSWAGLAGKGQKWATRIMKHPLLIPTPAIKKDPGSHVVRFLSTGKTRSCIRRACEKYCENQFEVTRLPEPISQYPSVSFPEIRMKRRRQRRRQVPVCIATLRQTSIPGSLWGRNYLSVGKLGRSIPASATL